MPNHLWLFRALMLSLSISAMLPSAGFAQTYVSNEVLLRFAPGASVACKDSAIASVSGTVVDSLKFNSTYRVQLPDTSVITSLTTLAGFHCVESALVNSIVDPDSMAALFVPNDAYYDSLTWLQNTGQFGGTPGADINAEEGWNFIRESPDVVIAIMDSGVDYLYHDDLLANIWTNLGETGGDSTDNDLNGYKDDVHGWNFYNQNNVPWDNYHHGTAVAGYAACIGNNNLGFPGVTFAAKIMPIRVLNQSGASTNEFYLAKAVEYAVDNEADILNVSLIYPKSPFPLTNGALLIAAFESAAAQGVVIVCGAGNSNQNIDSGNFIPQSLNLAGQLCVAGTDQNDNLAVNCGDVTSGTGASTVHIAAPACFLWATYPVNEYNGWHSGTSASSPMVAGAAALLKAQNPTWTSNQIKSRLMVTVDTLGTLATTTVSKGRLNLGRALDNVKPSSISDLTVDNVGENQMAIAWTDTGDDTTHGQATKYHFKYQTGSAITSDGQFASATTVPYYLGPPGASGTYHCVIISGLSSCTTYGWALKLEDSEFNIADLSNSALAWTDCYTSYAMCGGGLMAGGGDGGEGGGDESAEFPSETQVASTGMSPRGLEEPTPLNRTNEDASTMSWRAENALRVGVEDEATDLLAMKSIRPNSSGDYRVRLAATGDQSVVIADASLAVVDHTEGAAAMVAPSGIFTGTPGAIASASVGGTNRTSIYQLGEGAVSEVGETINVSLIGDGRTLLALDLSAQAATAEFSSGTVDIETQDRQGHWSKAARISPRRVLDRVAVDVTDAAGVRVQVGRRAFIRSISKLTQASEAEATWLDLSGLRLFGDGEAEPGHIALAPSEHAVLTFSGVNQAAGTERAVFLRVTSQSQVSAQFGGGTDTDGPGPEIAFALAMRPNPAAGNVAVDFTVVRDMPVKIRMYDVAGRLVRILADGPRTAGTHSVVWDGRNDAGARVHGGVYFCKMDVGSWTSMKKMVFIAQR